jgi:glycosyltransferase involved in cell wall biosynthesis
MPEALLNVLLLASRFEVRGSSRQTIHLGRYLPQHGIDTRIICADAGVIPTEQQRDLEIREVPFLESSLLRWWCGSLLKRELADRVPDLIHIQQRSMLNVGRAIAHRLQRPYLVSVHDYLAPRETLRLEWQWCRRILAVSESVKVELLAQTGMPADRITVIHSGVETATNVDEHDVLRPGEAPVVGTAGPLELSKGLRYFLDAVPKVLEHRRDAEFLIAGAGPEERNLRRQVRRLGIAEQVTFVPALMDIGSSLAAMDVFVLPAIKQGLGTMMLEAMVRGRPVIATGAGGVYSVVTDRETGLLVPPMDSQMLADRILELLADPLRARSIGHAARQMVQQQFTVEHMVEQTATVYREVLEQA